MDSLPEEAYDRFVRLAGRLTGSPTALVSLVDESRQYFKAFAGLGEPWASLRQTPLSHSLCQYVVTSGRPLVVEDARQDDILKVNLAIPEMGVVAYLGSPLRAGGECIGSVCAIDVKPRHWTSEDLAAMNDLAATVNSEIELRLAQQFSQRLADLTPAIIYLHDYRQEKTLYCNAAGQDRDLSSLIAARGNPSEVRLREPDGSWRWYLDRKAEILADGSQVLGLSIDTEALKQVESQLRAAVQAAEAATQAKAEFLAEVSHELRTPLQGILGSAEMALDLAQEARLRRLIQGSQRSARALLEIVDDLLRLHELEMGLSQPRREVFSLPARLEELRQELPAATERLDFAGPDELWLDDDWGKIRQVLVNLLGNALKYTSGRVRLEAREEQDQLRVTVADAGPGLDASELERIFQPFVRLVTHEAKVGTGLGLPLARRLAESLGGELTAHSAPEEGSQFVLRIPLRTAQAPQTREGAVALEPLRRRKVLVVDDHPLNRELCEMMLESLGQTVVLAACGKDALEAAQREAFDLVLMDLQMPDMDGYAVARALRGRDLQVVAMSADVREEAREACLAAGMQDVLRKPFTRADLSALLAR